MRLEHELARDLLAINAVQINPHDYFTWTSGAKSPIYCDNRLTMSYPAIRQKITEAFVKKIEDMQVKPDVIAGCAAAGIPHAAWLADRLNMPMVYVRSKAKGHGRNNQIEGHFEQGKKVVVIEDLISTGGSSINAVKALEEAGADVIDVLAIFTYGIRKSIENFTHAKVPLQTITHFEQLLDALVEDGVLKSNEKKELIAWRDSL